MPLRKLTLVPDAPGYSSAEGNDLVSTQLAGGFARVRRDKANSPKAVAVKWTLLPKDYEYWRAFFNTAINKGRDKFLCDLLSEDGTGAVEHICRIVPGSVQMPDTSGYRYVQSCQLEVRALPINAAHDEAVILVYEASDGDPYGWMNALAHVTLVTAPEYIGA